MTDLEWDANTVMEQSIWQSQGICRWGHYVDYLLEYPDMTIRDFFGYGLPRYMNKRKSWGTTTNGIL